MTASETDLTNLARPRPRNIQQECPFRFATRRHAEILATAAFGRVLLLPGPGFSSDSSQQPALLLLLRLRFGTEHRTDRLVEDRLQTLLRQRRALEVLDRPDLLCHGQTLRVSDWRKFLVSQSVNCLLVLPKVEFSSNENDGRRGTVVTHLGKPLCPDVFK